MTALLMLWKYGVGLLIGLAIGWFVMVPVAREAGRSAGYEAGKAEGAAEERAAWQKLTDDARREAEAKQRKAQARIAEIERDSHARDQARQADMDALEEALAAERADNAAPILMPSPAVPRACPPAISRRMSDALARIGGAATPRGDTAGSQAPVR